MFDIIHRYDVNFFFLFQNLERHIFWPIFVIIKRLIKKWNQRHATNEYIELHCQAAL